MPKFRVPVKTVVTEIFIVEAENKEEAMDLAIENGDTDYCKSIDLIDGDSEVYYPDIITVED
jgi:hypothetical protein